MKMIKNTYINSWWLLCIFKDGESSR